MLENNEFKAQEITSLYNESKENVDAKETKSSLHQS
jgi:hypothetical protein